MLSCKLFCFSLLAPRPIKLEVELGMALEPNTQSCFCQSIGALFIFLTSRSSIVAAIPHFSWYIKPGSGMQMIMLNESSPQPCACR